jgi:hypothetical protein
MNPLDLHSARNIEYRVQEHVIPALESILDSGLELATPRNALNYIGDVDHREHFAAAYNEICSRNLRRQTKLLLMPDNVVVKKERLRKLTGELCVSVNHNLPHLIGRHLAAHPSRDLETVRTALWKTAYSVRKEKPLSVSLANEFAAPLASDHAEAFFH